MVKEPSPLAQYHCHLVDPHLDELISQVLVLVSNWTLGWHDKEPVLPVKARKWLLPSEVGDSLNWVLV